MLKNEQFHGYQYTAKPIFKYDQITDSEGLQRAYKQGDYYVHGRTMFIAGSHTARDWFDDFTSSAATGRSGFEEKRNIGTEGCGDFVKSCGAQPAVVQLIQAQKRGCGIAAATA